MGRPRLLRPEQLLGRTSGAERRNSQFWVESDAAGTGVSVLASSPSTAGRENPSLRSALALSLSSFLRFFANSFWRFSYP